MKWGDQKRDHDTILAIWPNYRPIADRYFMIELVETEDGGVRWRDRRIPTERGFVMSEHHPDFPTALAAAERLNPTLAAALAARDIPEIERTSLTLKVRKALQSRQRLDDEERLMLAEAVRRHQDTPRQAPGDLKLHPEAEPYREELARELATYSYLRMALLRNSNRQVVLYRDADDLWSKPYLAGEKSAVSAMRARIANAFKFHQDQHWGQVKARIRAELLPRANQLLQLASVQRMLADALARGERVLVSNGIVFWYEPDGQLGWTVKATSSDKGQDGETLMRTVGRMPPEMLPKMTDGLMGLLALILILYLVAPTAQQLAGGHHPLNQPWSPSRPALHQGERRRGPGPHQERPGRWSSQAQTPSALRRNSIP